MATAHPVDTRLPFVRQLAFGIQHVLIMYTGCITVPLVFGAAVGAERLAGLVGAGAAGPAAAPGLDIDGCEGAVAGGELVAAGKAGGGLLFHRCLLQARQDGGEPGAVVLARARGL